MKFVAFERSLQGTGASRRLRHALTRCPASSTAPARRTMIELDYNALFHALQARRPSIPRSSRWNSPATREKVLLRDVQMHAWKQRS